MRPSVIFSNINRNFYLASEFLHRHRVIVILGAFVFWTVMLAKLGYFQDFGKTNTWFLIFGFLWLTVPASFATYFMPRILFKLIPRLNGYRHEEASE